ncbi:MAG: DinB family protein [Bacteroidia bacterium]
MKTQKTVSPQFSTLIENIVDLIEKGNAHVSLDNALKNIPFSLLGEKPGNLPYSIWQIVEHIRIAQWDIIEFSRNAKHISPKWPDGYWPKKAAPKSKEEWNKCIEQIHADRKSFIELIKHAGDNLYEPFEYGSGQSLLKEALVLADHNSYHTGEIIIIRRLLNAWK